MVAAIALVAMVEGRVTLAMLRSGMAEEDQSSDEHVAIADLADHLLDRMTLRQPDPIVEDAPNRWTPAALPYYRLTEAQRVLGERCLARLSPAPSLQSWLPDPNRLVDVGRLARRLGVSERRIYAAWPGTAGMNRDLLTAVFERERGRVESLAETAIAIGSDGEYTTFELLLSTALNALVRSTARPGHVNYFAGTAALADLEVARLVSARIEGWRSSVRIMFLAVMAMSGANRRPGITATIYSDTMMESIMGLQRLVALHPGLADQGVALRGEVHPICGLALLEIGSSLTTNGSPGQADPAMPAPPLP